MLNIDVSAWLTLNGADHSVRAKSAGNYDSDEFEAIILQSRQGI